MANKEFIQPIGQEKPQASKLNFIDKKQTNGSFERVASFMEEFKKLHKETDPYQDEATVKVNNDNPVTIYAIGDVHFGAASNNMELFKRDMEIIRQTPNAYMVILSNMIDAFIPTHHAGGKLDSPLRLDVEAEAMNGLMKELASEEKVLAMVQSPCHEGWVDTHAGVDIQKTIFRDTGIPMLENGGVLNMEFLNGKVFRAGLWHQPGSGGEGKNTASWNHQSKSRIGTMDAIMIGHSHVSESEQAFFGEHPNRNEVVLIRSGSYKGNVSNEKGAIADRFQRGHSGRDGEPGGQAVTFIPRTGELRSHFNPLRAAEYQQKLNKFAILESTGKLEDIWEAAKTIVSKIDQPQVKSEKKSIPAFENVRNN
jgi:hypothetical protein